MNQAQDNASISKLATIAAGAATIGLGLPTLGILGIHAGLLSPMLGFSLFGAGTLLGGVSSLLLGSLGLLSTRGGRDPQGRRRAWTGTIGGLALLGAVMAAGAPSANLPPINDITTDLGDPPAFAGDPSDRDGEGRARDMTYPVAWKELVLAAYPDLETIRVDVNPAQAFVRAVQTAKQLGWAITAEDAAGGTFEAKSTTAIFQFVDDVVVRVRPDGAGSVIDLRSKSRDGQGDLGANANRIRAFLSAL